MAFSQVTSAPSPTVSEAGNISQKYGDGLFQAVTLRGRPIDKSRTGRMSAAKYIYALVIADFATTISVGVGLLFYLYTYLYQPISTAATISNNYTGTTLLTAVLGGFLADSYLGHYVTIVIGAVIQSLGLAVLVLSSDYSKLVPPACTATLTKPCSPAGAKYMAPLYVGLYTIALGSGLTKAGTPALGAEQFDESDSVEREQSVRYFVGFYFAENVGLLIAFTLSVYILSYVSKDWGFAWLLILYVVSFIIFLVGTRLYRHKKPGGSFLTRIVQVFVCAIRKWRLPVPEDSSRLYDAPISGGWLERSRKLRFLDKAAIIENEAERGNPWMLAGVTQVEETKRIFLLIPVWLCTWYVSLLFSQILTFTETQGQTLNRSLSKHFNIPPQSLAFSTITFAMIAAPAYDKILRPITRKITGNPFGITPLTRIGISLIAGSIAMIVAALVERKRLKYVRDRGYEHLEFFEVPMKMYWLLPQYFFTAIAEFFLEVSIYEFFYHEVSDNTRSIGSSFSFSALSMGFYFSSVLVNITNSLTKNQKGGRWLVERLNNGGLENFYWLLAAILGLDFLVFLVVAYFYQYNYTGYLGTKQAARVQARESYGTDDQKEVESFLKRIRLFFRNFEVESFSKRIRLSFRNFLLHWRPNKPEQEQSRLG